MAYTPMTSEQLLKNLRGKDTSPERIIEVMVRRADRYQEWYTDARKIAEGLNKKVNDLWREMGKLVTVEVDHIARDNWGSYTWYKCNKYRWDGEKWVKDKRDNTPHYMAHHHYGKFKVDILLSEEDMPEVFIGECKGSVLGKKVILAEGHMIGYGDEFEIRKVVKNA